MDDDFMTGINGPKVRRFTDAHSILAKLEGKAALWDRAARDNKERAEDFERAAQHIREGATAVTVGRTTYVLATSDPDEVADGDELQA